MIKKKNPSETIRLLILLSIIGGITDTYTFFVRGKVFVNAHTGNFIYLTLHLLQGEWFDVIFYIIPISVFALGIFTAEFLKDFSAKNKTKKLIHWRQIGLYIEILIFIIAAFIPIGKYDIYVNTFLAYVSALQYQSFKKTYGNVVATTMCTGNLRNGIETLYSGIINKNIDDIKRAQIYFGSIFYFFIGCIISISVIKLLTYWNIQEKSILLCIPFAILALKFMNKKYVYNRKLLILFINIKKFFMKKQKI